MDHIVENLYIGDEDEAAKRNRLELNGIVHVVTLSDDETPYTTVHHPIDDGANDQAEFDRAVDIVLEALEREENVLVHCASGISRSVTVVATAIAEDRGLEFEDALELVAGRRPRANPHPEMRTHARTYLSRA